MAAQARQQSRQLSRAEVLSGRLRADAAAVRARARSNLPTPGTPLAVARPASSLPPRAQLAPRAQLSPRGKDTANAIVIDSEDEGSMDALRKQVNIYDDEDQQAISEDYIKRMGWN
jgi:hypothetical protein